MTTYYHVTWGDWDGEDLLCYGARIEDGEEVRWKWEEAAPGWHSDLVSLYRDLASAIAFRDAWCPDREIHRVELPEDDEELERLGAVVVRDSEGDSSILMRIPAALITRAQVA